MDIEPDGPELPEPSTAPRIGDDEWVASHESRRRGATRGRSARSARGSRRSPSRCSSPSSASPPRLVPLFTNNGYVIRVGFDTLIYMLLALGLNIVVGFAGLLDLGYVAFFGFGAYGYAMLASSQFDLHWPTLAILPLVTARDRRCSGSSSPFPRAASSATTSRS